MKGKKVTLDVQQTSDKTNVRSRNGIDFKSPFTETDLYQKMARNADATTART